ncbi:MAG: hypothetical protein HQ508_03925 [Candidatus Marinimicrobia bacterium]|nr:hypothetical protein [Candidatus Neomarinimicrobiota bacterium]
MPTGSDIVAIQVKLVGAAILLFLSFILGYWLNNMDKPYQIALLTSHKLISLAAFVLLCIVVYRLGQSNELSSLDFWFAMISGLLFVICIISGGLLSTHLELPALVKISHHISPFLAVIFSGITLYLTVYGKS